MRSLFRNHMVIARWIFVGQARLYFKRRQRYRKNWFLLSVICFAYGWAYKIAPEAQERRIPGILT